MRRFEAVYSPELVGGEVLFADYEMVAGKLETDALQLPSRQTRRAG